jgi:hypothetical protein
MRQVTGRDIIREALARRAVAIFGHEVSPFLFSNLCRGVGGGLQIYFLESTFARHENNSEFEFVTPDPVAEFRRALKHV